MFVVCCGVCFFLFFRSSSSRVHSSARLARVSRRWYAATTLTLIYRFYFISTSFLDVRFHHRHGQSAHVRAAACHRARLCCGTLHGNDAIHVLSREPHCDSVNIEFSTRLDILMLEFPPTPSCFFFVFSHKIPPFLFFILLLLGQEEEFNRSEQSSSSFYSGTVDLVVWSSDFKNFVFDWSGSAWVAGGVGATSLAFAISSLLK